MNMPVKKKNPSHSNEIADLQKTLGVSNHELAVLLDTTPRTLYRWKANQSSVDYDSLRRLQETVSLARESLRKEALSEWFHEPNLALGGSVPIRLLADLRGYMIVTQLLGQAAFGLPL